jgi:hypothetical protein
VRRLVIGSKAIARPRSLQPRPNTPSTPIHPEPDDDGAGAFEQTLCQVRTVHVFKIPTRVTSGGHRAGDWKDEVWQGSLKVVQKGPDAAVLLVDPKTSAWVGFLTYGLLLKDEMDGLLTVTTKNIVESLDALFAMCPVKDGSVERCVDSSRYYVLKIQNAQG